MRKPVLRLRQAICWGSSSSSACRPVRTLQKLAQARVQVSPMIMNVGVALVPVFANTGTARLQTVASLIANQLKVSANTGELAAHADPGWLAGDRLVRPVRLLGMAQARSRSWPGR